MGTHSDVEIIDPRFKAMVLPNAPLELLGDGFRWLEGPVWFGDQDCLLFSDLPNDRIMRWTQSGGVSVFRQPSGFANGHTRDRQGRLIGCSHRERCITRTELDGRVVVLADRFEGKRLNSPNDVIVKSDDTIWFSDPPYGIQTDYEGGKQVPERPACVYRLVPSSGELSVVSDQFTGPNGLCFSPDETRLYVCESGLQFDPSPIQHIAVMDVGAEGIACSKPSVFHKIDPGFADGIRCDEDGNVWSSAADGVHCIAPSGELLGKIRVPFTVSNLTFGGRNRSRLFICASHSLFAIYTNQRGAQRPLKPTPITRIIRISRNVVELDRSTAFYQDRLGFQASGPVFIMERALAAELGFGARDVNVQRLRLGEEELELVEAGTNARSYPSPNTSADLVFQHLAVRCMDIDIAFKRLYREDSATVPPTAISRNPDCGPAPIRLPDSSGGVTAFKFRDPDGHPLELLQRAGDEVARSTVRAGIDHTAISVSTAPPSIAFYADLLGLTVSSYQTNSGSEQGSLDALESPIVDIVALQTTSELSPHLELLAYRRPIAPASHTRAEATDIVSDRIVIRCSDVSRLATNLGMVSLLIRLASGELALLFRDPDGHFFLAIE